MTEEEVKSAQRSKINSFKRRFSNKSISELEMIVNNDKLFPEAIKAAEEFLEERKS